MLADKTSLEDCIMRHAKPGHIANLKSLRSWSHLFFRFAFGGTADVIPRSRAKRRTSPPSWARYIINTAFAPGFRSMQISCATARTDGSYRID